MPWTNARMTITEAEKAERPKIVSGARYPFYSSAQDTNQNDNLPGGYRAYSGQFVEVLGQTHKGGEDTTPLYLVRADDGNEFEAYEDELNGWAFDTGQWFPPST